MSAESNQMDEATLAALAETERVLSTISIDEVKKEADRQHRRKVARELLDERRNQSKPFDPIVYDCMCARCHEPTKCEIANDSWPYAYFNDIIHTHCETCVKKITYKVNNTYPCNQCEMRLPISFDPTRQKMCSICDALFGDKI